MKSLVISFLMVLLVSTIAFSQTASHKAKTKELFKVMNMNKSYGAIIDQTMSQMVSQNAALSSKEAALKAFFEKYMSWNALEEDMINLYATEFTEKEIEDMTIFYKTETGKKTIEKMPILFSKGAMIGQQKVMEHQAELMQMLQE